MRPKCVKFAVAVLLCFAVIFQGCGESNSVQKFDDGFYENGTYYYFNGGTGKGELKEGKHHGEWTFYNEKGVLATEGSFDMGVETGPWKFYGREGNLQREGAFQEGKPHGHWKIYFEWLRILVALRTRSLVSCSTAF